MRLSGSVIHSYASAGNQCAVNANPLLTMSAKWELEFILLAVLWFWLAYRLATTPLLAVT